MMATATITKSTNRRVADIEEPLLLLPINNSSSSSSNSETTVSTGEGRTWRNAAGHLQQKRNRRIFRSIRRNFLRCWISATKAAAATKGLFWTTSTTTRKKKLNRENCQSCRSQQQVTRYLIDLLFNQETIKFFACLTYRNSPRTIYRFDMNDNNNGVQSVSSNDAPSAETNDESAGAASNS